MKILRICRFATTTFVGQSSHSLRCFSALAVLAAAALFAQSLLAQGVLPAPTLDVQPAIPPVPGESDLVEPAKGPLAGVYRAARPRNHWVVLNDGLIRGRVLTKDRMGRESAAGDMYLKLLRKGVTIATTTSDDSGIFEFRGLGPGVYGMYGLGPSGMLAFSMRVVGEEDPRSVEAMPPDGLQLALLAIPPPFQAVAGILRNSALRSGALRLTSAEQRLSAALVSSRVQPKLRVIQFGPAEIPSLGMSATSIRHHVIDLQPDGSMRGAVRVLELTPEQLTRVDHSGLTVYLIRNDQRVQQSAVFEDGSFEVTSLRPGVYGFVVAGSWRYKDVAPPTNDAQPNRQLFGPPQFGFAAIQIETRQATDAPPNPGDKGTEDKAKTDAQLVSLNKASLKDPGFQLEIALLQQMSIEELRDFWESLTPEQQAQLLAGLGAPPTASGGGGGGDGFGALLALLGLAGFAGGGGGGGNGAPGSPAE